MSLILIRNNEFTFNDTGEIFTPKYQDYSCPEDYIKDGVIPIEPMCAKEEDREEELEKMLAPNSGYYIEEKFDGTRALNHIDGKSSRVFSRRISVKTDWYSENSDSLPQLRRLRLKEWKRTVIDGELFIPNRPFKDVSGTLNCLWDEAVRRQIDLGEIVLHVFDIIWYKGIYIARMPLWKRKQYLQKVVDELDSPYVKMVQYSDTTITVDPDLKFIGRFLKGELKEVYPTLHEELEAQKNRKYPYELSKRAYYEYIVATGGEGVILKDKNGKYYHKRGREYTKLKKFITREVVIIRFDPPTKEYKGKFPTPEKWRYWESYDGVVLDTSDSQQFTEVQSNPEYYVPVSKFYAENWVGNVVYGVLVTPKEKDTLLRTKKGKDFIFHKVCGLDLVEVGDCSGYNEEQRYKFTKNKEDYIGKVIEVKANELFKDTGKLRHPRFLRERPDKNADQCTWKDHLNLD